MKNVDADSGSVPDPKPWGFQLIVDCFGCDEDVCRDLNRGYEFLDKITLHLGVRKQAQPYIFKTCETAFPGRPGYSGWIPIMESGIQIHTSANNRFISIDIYSCRPFETPEVISFIEGWFKPELIDTNFFPRGKDLRRKCSAVTV